MRNKEKAVGLDRQGKQKSYRRNKQRTFKRFFGLTMSLYILMFSCSILPGFGGKANAGVKKGRLFVYIDSVTVKEGDTLWSLSKAYKSEYYTNTLDYVMAIKECNGLEGDIIKPGDHIMIPYTERR